MPVPKLQPVPGISTSPSCPVSAPESHFSHERSLSLLTAKSFPTFIPQLQFTQFPFQESLHPLTPAQNIKSIFIGFCLFCFLFH